ncbi:unnamed protein product [Caenorhabditis nigoni]
MPHLVMSQILDNVGFLAILNLRKTCKSFRNFIDDVKLNNELKKVNIFLGHQFLSVRLVLETNGIFKLFFVSYQIGSNDNCYLVYKKEPELAEEKGGSFLKAFLNDFGPILKNQRSKLTDLGIEVVPYIYEDIYDLVPQSKFQSIFSRCLCSRFKKFKSVLKMTADERNRQRVNTASEVIDRFEQILKSRTVPLKVENLDLTVFESSQIFQILPFIETKSLKGRQLCEGTRTLNAIPKCETFKNMESLKLTFILLMNPISDFLDIPKLSIKRESISREDIVFSKQAFLTNSHLKKWEMKFMNLEDYGMFQKVLGHNQYDQERQWFFKIPNSEEILSVYVNVVFDTISFTRITTDDVPKYALIR